MLKILLENPLPILAVGAILATLSGLVFLSRRNVPSLVALGAVVLFTSLLLITEQLIVTPAEEIEVTIDELLTAIEANDVETAKQFVDEASGMRANVEKMMPTVDVEDCGATAIDIIVDKGSSPLTATSEFKGRLRGLHRSSGFQVMYFDRVDMQWVRRDERWLIEGFTVYHDGKAIDPVGSLSGKQPVAVPAR